MVELKDTMETEMDLTGITVKITPKEEVTPPEIDELINLFQTGYGEKWNGEDYFRNVVMRNNSDIVRLFLNGTLAAASLVNIRRITDIAVHPSFQGRGLGVRLFQEAVRFRNDIWITIGVDAEAMLHTVTDQRLHFLPVEDQTVIEGLYRGINGVGDDFAVEIVEVTDPDLSERLARKGVRKDSFMVFYRHGSVHNQNYKQILWQNQS